MSDDSEAYAKQALSIGDSAIQSRSGFGSFGKYHRLFERSHSLVTRSSLLASPNGSPHPLWAIDPDYVRFAIHHGHYNHAHFIRNLTSPTIYHPSCIWALFWALAKGEHQFLRRYLPFWSHEERLTGHFVSQICERIEEFAGSWSALSAGEPKESWLDIWYADTAAGNREKTTGADLGLIIHGQYSGDGEFFKVARFQVKKVPSSNTVTIDLDQTKALLRKGELGYYLFFHAQDRNEWRRPPSVAPAKTFEQLVLEKERALTEGRVSGKSLGNESASNVDNHSFDFATFITFALADPATDFGAAARSKSDAVYTLMAGGPPTRLAVISLGTKILPAEWLSVMSEYVQTPHGDNE